MSTTSASKRLQPNRTIHHHSFFAFRAAIALGYMGLGVVFVMGIASNILLSPEMSPYFGGALIIYGAFRMYRAWRAWSLATTSSCEVDLNPSQPVA